MSEAARDLERAARGPVPETFAQLDSEQIALLAAAIEATKANQRSDLSRAIDNGLGFVPRMLRGAVKRSLFG